MAQGQGTWNRIDAAVRAGTGRIHGLTGLLVAIFSFGVAATLLWSLVVGFGERQLLIQIPWGPQFVISEFSKSGDQQETEQRAADQEPLAELEPIGVEHVMPMLSPLPAGGGVCVYGAFGGIKLYPPGRRRGGHKP